MADQRQQTLDQARREFESIRLDAAAYSAATIITKLEAFNVTEKTKVDLEYFKVQIATVLVGDERFTPSQAQDFVKRYIPLAGINNDGAGLVIFKDTDTNTIVPATRGTNSAQDLIADTAIAQGRLPTYQTVELVNYALKATASPDQSVPQLRVVGINSNAEDAIAATMTTILPSNPLAVPKYEIAGYTKGTGQAVGTCINATGHSEAGPEAQVIAAVLGCGSPAVYNAPGVVQEQMQTVLNAYTDALEKPRTTIQIPDALVIDSTGPSVVSGLNGGLTGAQSTLPIPWSINPLNWFDNHGSVTGLNAAETRLRIIESNPSIQTMAEANAALIKVQREQTGTGDGSALMGSTDALGNYQPGASITDSVSSSPSPTASSNAAGSTQLPPISPTAQDADMGSLNTSGGDNVSSVSDADLRRPASVFNAATALPGYAGEQGVTVQAGDTVTAIAQRYGMDTGEYKAFLQQQYGADADLNSIVAGRRLPLPPDVYERTQGGINGPDLSDAPPAPQAPGDASDMLDALTDVFENADQSAAALKDKYGSGVQVADASNGLPQESASNQTPAQTDAAQAAIKTEASETEPASGTTSSGAASLNIGTATAYAQSMLSAVNLMQALQSGNTLSAALNAAGLANTLGHTFGDGPVVSQELTGGLTALSSALNLLDNLQHGNTLGALSSSLSAGSWVANAMAEHYTSVALEAITEGGVNLAAESAALELSAAGNAMSGAVPFVGMALAMQSGNPTSMLAAAANFIPVYGPLISIGISLLGSGGLGGLFGGGATPPPPYGEVHFAWSGLDANGQPHTAVRTDTNVSGGAGTASQIAGQLLHSLQTMVEQANAQTLQDHPNTDPTQLLALNTNLLPSVFWDKDQTSLKLPNPDGATSFFVNLAEPDAMAQVVQLLQTNGGIAPQWLVDTQSQRYAQLLSEGADGATIERELTAGKSGLTEQTWSQAAAIQGSAGEAADFKTQQFGSLVVHAQGAQVQLTGALKNIDADAYLERSEWVAASDAQGQAQSLLVIDFNADGVIDTRDVLNLGGNRGQTDAKDAQMQGDYADLQRNNVLWLDANGDGVLDAKDPAFAAVKLYMDINADARVQDGEAQGLAQAGITAIDFTAGQVRYADGHSDALTAQLLTGETSGVKLTKVYEMVDGQQVDLHAGDVLESEGYQGQDASGAIRQQTFAHEAVRTGDWEGTAEQEAHRHGGGNVADAPAQTTASGAESQGEFKTQAQTTSQRTVVANQIRQTQTPERLAFVPLGIGLNGIGSLPEAGLVTADMVQSMQAGLLGGGGLNLGLLGVLAVGATQSAAQAADAQVLAAANTSAGLLPGDLSTLGSLTANGQGEALAAPSNSDGAVVGAIPVQGTALSLSAVPGPASFAALGGEVPIVAAPATGSEKSATTGASAPVTSAPPLLWQAALTSAPLANAQPGNPSGTRGTDQAPADAASPVDAAAVGAAAQGASNCTVLDYPVVRGETLSGNEDVIFRIPGTLLVSNDRTPNAPANPAAPALTVTAVGNAVHGQVALINGEVVFVPEANFFGTASFMYAATDQYGLSRTATASLEVSAVNDAPAVTGGEEIDGEEEQALIIQAAGLLQNDYDVDNPHEDLALSRVQSGTGGTVSLDANGDVVFTPDHDFFGNAAFTYWVRDSAGAESSPVTATVVVAPVNDAPGAQGEEVAGASEDAVFTISKSTLLANDHDVDDPNSALSVNWVGNTTGGTVSLDASGNVVFTPTVNFNGYASFSYTVRDAAGLVSPVVLATIPVAAVNDAPLGVDDQFSTYRNSTMSIGFGQLTGNDSDVENDVLTVSSVRDNSNGHASIVDGKVQFLPTTGFAGTASFDYLADDGQGGQTWTTAYVNVIVPPQYPTVNVTLGSSWVEVYHGDAANLRQTFNYSFDDENPATVSMTIQPNFGAGFTYAGFGDVRWVTATDFNIFKYDRYGNANISLNLNLTDESGLTNTAHVYVRYSSLPNGVSQFDVWHDHTGYATPVVLDLDGQGLQAVATKDSNVTFDVDEDGVADRMAWVGAGNGVLALDIDGDDKISDAKEFVFKQYVAGAQTDLEGLTAFDTNRDAKLDINDDLFAKFGVWQDADSNGIQDAGEYQTLVQLGIASIDLRSNAQVQGVNSEVVSFGSAQFTRADGSTGVAYDAMLAYQSGADQAAALIGSASLEDTTSIPIPSALPATLGDADVLNANAMQMALLFNQMCNTAPANDPGLLGFVPIEADACAQNWDEVAQLQLQVA